MINIKIKDRLETAYNVEDFPYNSLIENLETFRHHKITYYNIPCAFDIETTTISCGKMKTCPYMFEANCLKEDCKNWISPYAFMYHWQVCIKDNVCFGRRWEEYSYFIERVSKILNLGNKLRLVFYVHNLSFEFQFMNTLFEWKEIFALDHRKILKAFDGFIEYRCSWKLSNMSLEKFCENTPNCYYQKMKGLFDYDIIRTYKTEMNNTELAYCFCDVRGLCECIGYLLKDDTIASIPLTNTGYVRRDCRLAVLKNVKNKKRILNEKLSAKQYILCKEAFRGGDTHASYLLSGEVIEKVKSKDISSSYPYVMMVEKFPGKFIKGNKQKLEEYLLKDLALLMVVKFKDVKYKGEDYIPYIPLSKCRCLEDNSVLKKTKENQYNLVIDNGRILKADGFEMTITEIDWNIIYESYSFDYEIKDIYISKKKMLPSELREKIKDYFLAKSTLKGIDDKLYEYMKSKNRLNGIYGMSVTDIVKNEWKFEDGNWIEKESDLKNSLKRYYEGQNSFLSYQWGVWVTAYARRNLRKGLEYTKGDTVYVDTDSIKYIGNHDKSFNEYNNEIIFTIKNVDIPPLVEYKGKTYTMGTFDDDGEYVEFITWGAKKYCYKQNGEYHTTVAGLAKKEGAKIVNERGIESFKPGTVFYPSGRTVAVYGDEEPHTICVNGVEFLTAGFCAILPSTYKLSISPDYKSLIKKD